jgi:hypothetical protein
MQRGSRILGAKGSGGILNDWIFSLLHQIKRQGRGQNLHRKIEKLKGLFLKFPGKITET